MRRQITACIFVGIALLMLFKGGVIIETGWWMVSQTLPGGLRVSYFSDKSLTTSIFRRTERQVVKAYNKRRLSLGHPRKGIYARWDGFLLVPQEAEYEFYLQSDEGSRLYIDGDKVMDRWDEHAWNPGSHGKIKLLKGKHVIRIEHCSDGGEAAIRLRWCGGPIPPNTVVKTPYIIKK